MFDCDKSITGNTNSRLFCLQNKGMRQIEWPVCRLFTTVSSFFVLQNNNICPKALVKSHEAYWLLGLLHPILSAKRDVSMWLSRVLCLKGHKVICRFLVKSFLSSSISGIISSNTNMSRNPHKVFPLGSTSVSCSISWICINRGWLGFNFSNTCNAHSK